MRFGIRRMASIAAIVLVLVASLACGKDADDDDGLSVVASIYPLGYFTERIGGDRVTVTTLVGPGVEAHGFEPTASDLRTIGAADLVVMNGLELEPWLERALDALEDSDTRVVLEAADESQAIAGAMHGHEDEGHEEEGEGHDHEGEGHEEEGEGHAHELDPHMWLDPVLAVVQVERIRDALINADADNANVFRENAAALINELNELHAEFSQALSSCRHDHFVTSHAAYGYLAARYAVEQIPIAGLSPEAEPSPQQLAEITDRIIDLGLGHVLVEPVVAGTLEETIQRETGIELIPIHAIESVTQAELDAHDDYFGLMRDNLASLKLSLECA